MSMRWMITCVFLMLMNKASLESTVEAVVGGSVILPCHLTSGVPRDEKGLTFFWRDDDDKKVFDIFQGRPAEDQDTEYKGRTESFGSVAYAKGNFSIKLSNVTASDEGEYFCYRPNVDEPLKVELQVKAAPPQTTTESTNEGVESRSVRSLLIFSVLLGYNIVPL